MNSLHYLDHFIQPLANLTKGSCLRQAGLAAGPLDPTDASGPPVGEFEGRVEMPCPLFGVLRRTGPLPNHMPQSLKIVNLYVTKVPLT